jgi:hypothetical protein
MDKSSELSLGLSGILTLVLMVVIALQALQLPINLITIIGGMLVFVFGSIAIGFVLIVFFLIYAHLLSLESNESE